MASRIEKRTIKEERVTYLKGVFRGKYRAYADNKNSTDYTSVFDIHVYKGEVTRFDIPTSKEEYINVKSDKLFNFNFSKILATDFNSNSFEIDLKGAKIRDVKIYNVTKDDNTSFGTLECEIFGYIIDIIEREEYYEVTEIENIEENIQLTVEPKTQPPSIWNRITKSTFKPSWKKSNPYYGRTDNSNSSFWNEIASAGLGCFGLIYYIIGGLFLLSVIIGIISTLKYWSIPIILFLILLFFGGRITKGIGSVFGFFLPIFSWLFRSLFYILALGFFIAVLSAIFGSLKDIDFNIPTNTGEEVSADNIELDQIANDSIIVHKRNWVDYANNSYDATVIVKGSDFNNSRKHREQSNYIKGNEVEWNLLYTYILNKDLTNLNQIISQFDSIRIKNQLNNKELAELIVSFVQDIPYALVVQQSCYEAYQDPEIREMMSVCQSNCCIGNVKYGLHTPIEFLGSLYGDCDTRTVLSYAILDAFNFDVIVVGSLYYGHSLLGINLPYQGTSKSFNNKQYYLWETTSTGFEPGQISPDINNMKYWDIHLYNKP